MGRIRTPRRSQPQQPVAVDFPYAKASLCVNYAVGGKNLIDGSNPSVRSGAGTRAPSAFGVCKTGYDGGSNTAADVYGIPSTSVFTLVCVYDLSGSSGSYSPIIGGDQTGNRQFQLRVTPSNTIEFIRFNTSVSTFTATTTTTGRTGCIVAVSNGSSVRLIHKGIVSSTATITGTPKPLTVVAPGGYLGFDQQPLVGDIGVSMCAVLPFALSNAEAVALSLNPWQIFAPTTRNISSPVTAGGDTASIAQADGSSTASSLGGSATAATTPAGATGTSTAASIAASTTAAAGVTQADGASTASTLGGSAANTAAITQADAATTASTLTGAGLTAGASSITAAAGTSAESTLAGSSVAASDVSAAGGVSTGETLTGVAGTNIVAGSITPASGGTTASDFAASATAAAVAIAAAGASAAATLTSNGVMAVAGAMAGRRMAVTGKRPDRLQTATRPAR